MQNETASFCSSCGGSISQNAKFCSSCGVKLVASPSLAGQLAGLPAPRKAALAAAVALVFVGTFGLQKFLEARTGLERPTELYQPPQNPGALPPGHPGGSASLGKQSVAVDPALLALKSAHESEPENLEKMKAYAVALTDVLRADPQATPELALDAVDVLSRILQKTPEDAEALVMMADVSFDQKAFTKAVDFYQRYLKKEPTDFGARARYASTLTFLGKFDESITELKGILDKDEKNFPAMAYLAITYAQKGDIQEAKKVAALALDSAPSDEARARFSSFVTSLNESSQPSTTAQVPEKSLPIDKLVGAMKSNPVAGPKFVRGEMKGSDTVLLFFKDFPMQAMPPFAKEKFFTSVKSSASEAVAAGVRKITFMEASDGSELETLSLVP